MIRSQGINNKLLAFSYWNEKWNHRGHRENKRADTKDKDKEKVSTEPKGKGHSRKFGDRIRICFYFLVFFPVFLVKSCINK